jgi:hypothetical protein
MYICEINVTFLVESCILLFHKKYTCLNFSIHILNIRGFPLCIKRSTKKKNTITVRSPERSRNFLNLNLMLRETNSRGLFNSVLQNQLNPMRNVVLDFKNIKLHWHLKRNSVCGFLSTGCDVPAFYRDITAQCC